MTFALNTILQGRYRIIRQLGQGGMGTVYEAIDERLNSLVAIKEGLIDDDEGRKAFEREANLLANLRHSSLPKVIDHFIEDDRQFLVMEFIQGIDLAKLLAQRGRAFSPEQVLHWGEIILNALIYLHRRNPPILHRDIKPANLKIDEDGELFLLDFGLAKGAAGQMPTLMTSRSVRGFTPVYSPLEQIQGTGTNERSDLYSLGATLYHLITGTVPPDALSRATAIMSEQADPLRPANEINSVVPAFVADVLHQAMANNPAKRPASAAEMRTLMSDGVQKQAAAKSDLRETMLPPTVFSPAPTQSSQAPEAADIPPTLAAVATDQENLSENRKLRLEYWTTFRDFILQSNSFLKPQKPQAQTWFPITICPYFKLEAFTQRKERKICVYLILYGPDAKTHFHLLQRDKESIEYEIGEGLKWREHTKGKQSQVFLCKDKTDPENRLDWEAQHEWLKEKLELFHKVFAPRVKILNSGDYVSGKESEFKPARVDSTVAAATIAPVTTSLENLTESQKLHLEYWTEFIESLRRHNSLIVPKKPSLLHSMNFFPFGRSRIKLTAFAHDRDKWIGVGLVLYGSDAKPHFHLLHKHKEEVEKKIGASLEWKERPMGKESYIYLRRNSIDPNNRQDWPNQHEWLAQNLETFNEVFAPEIQTLDVSGYSKDKISPAPSGGVSKALLQESTATQDSPIIASPSAIQPAPSTEPVSPLAQVQPSTPPVQSVRKSNRLTWMIGGIVALLVISVVIALIAFRNSNSASQNTSSDKASSSDKAKDAVDPYAEFDKKVTEVDKAPDRIAREMASENGGAPLDSSDAQFLYLYGRALMLSGMPMDAVEAFRRAIEKMKDRPSRDPLKVETKLSAAVAAVKTGNWATAQKAAKELDEVIEINSVAATNPSPIPQSGFPISDETFDKLIREVDKFPVIMASRLESYSGGKPLDSSDSKFLYLYGRALLLSGKPTNALEAIKRAIEKEGLPARNPLKIKARLLAVAAALKTGNWLAAQTAAKELDDVIDYANQIIPLPGNASKKGSEEGANYPVEDKTKEGAKTVGERTAEGAKKAGKQIKNAVTP